MLCSACQYGLVPDEVGSTEPDWPEPKCVVYESKYGLVPGRYVWSQAAADRWLETFQHMGQIPRLVEVAEVRQRQAEARVGHPRQYRQRKVV